MIIFLYGEDSFRPRQKIRELKEKYLARNPEGMGLRVFDCEEEKDLEDTSALLHAKNLFARKQLFIIRNPFRSTTAEQQKKLQELISQKTEDILVLWEEGLPRKNNAFFIFLQKNAHKRQYYGLLEGAHLATWVRNRLATIAPEAKIAATAITELIVFVGNDLFQLDRELQKLSLYKGQKEITTEDVSTLVHEKVSADIFSTLDALATDDKKTAMALLQRHLRKGDDPYYIFTMYAYQLRTLLLLVDLYSRGETDYRTLAKKAKIHPFVVQKTMRHLQKFSLERLLHMHKKLHLFDFQIKTGKQDILTALELFVAQA